MRKFSPGVRIGRFDAVALALMLAFLASFPALGIGHGIGSAREKLILAAMATAIATFLLFCNVFRVRRSLELVWAGCFVALTTVSFLRGWPSWQTAIVIAWIGVAMIISLEVRSPSYHGFGWEAINPNLPDWWRDQGNE